MYERTERMIQKNVSSVSRLSNFLARGSKIVCPMILPNRQKRSVD